MVRVVIEQAKNRSFKQRKTKGGSNNERNDMMKLASVTSFDKVQRIHG